MRANEGQRPSWPSAKALLGSYRRWPEVILAFGQGLWGHGIWPRWHPYKLDGLSLPRVAQSCPRSKILFIQLFKCLAGANRLLPGQTLFWRTYRRWAELILPFGQGKWVHEIWPINHPYKLDTPCLPRVAQSCPLLKILFIHFFVNNISKLISVVIHLAHGKLQGELQGELIGSLTSFQTLAILPKIIEITPDFDFRKGFLQLKWPKKAFPWLPQCL